MRFLDESKSGADLAQNLTVAGSAKRELHGGPGAEPPENFLVPRPLRRGKRPIWRLFVKEVEGHNIT